MFDIRTAWRRLTAKISGNADREIIDTTEAEDGSGAATTEEAAEPADDGATGEVVGQEGMAPEEDMGQHIDAGGDGVMCVN